MRFCIPLIVMLPFVRLLAQTSDPVAGHYTASLNEDPLTLILEQQSGDTYTGTMKDSYQTYTMNLRRSGNMITGTATEASLGLQFEVSGQIQGVQLPLRFTVDFMGEKTTMDIAFSKTGPVASPVSGGPPSLSDIVFPSDATHPGEIMGTWAKEEMYQSGYGDNFMGAGFTQSMTFLPNGRLADGGSAAYMSGSHYSAQSGGQGDGVIPGLAWYTIGNQIYLLAMENGQTQTLHLGKYYVENNHMLITGNNGEKILLSRR